MKSSLVLVGGTTLLNLVNTNYISNGNKIDILGTLDSTLAWLIESHLIREKDVYSLKNNKSELGKVQERLLLLRKTCVGIVKEIEKKHFNPSNSLDSLKIVVDTFRIKVNVLYELELDDEPKIVYKGVTLLDDISHQIAGSITHTFKKKSLDRIKKCEHEDCILYFMDTSKGGKRRWCRMDTCGNKFKASSFYARNKSK